MFCFLLDAGHVEDIEGGQLGFEVGGLLIGLVERRQRLVLDVLRDAQFLRRDEDEPVPLKLAQRRGAPSLGWRIAMMSA